MNDWSARDVSGSGDDRRARPAQGEGLRDQPRSLHRHPRRAPYEDGRLHLEARVTVNGTEVDALRCLREALRGGRSSSPTPRATRACAPATCSARARCGRAACSSSAPRTSATVAASAGSSRGRRRAARRGARHSGPRSRAEIWTASVRERYPRLRPGSQRFGWIAFPRAAARTRALARRLLRDRTRCSRRLRRGPPFLPDGDGWGSTTRRPGPDAERLVRQPRCRSGWSLGACCTLYHLDEPRLALAEARRVPPRSRRRPAPSRPPRARSARRTADLRRRARPGPRAVRRRGAERWDRRCSSCRPEAVRDYLARASPPRGPRRRRRQSTLRSRSRARRARGPRRPPSPRSIRGGRESVRAAE